MLAGKRTYIAALLMALVGVNHALREIGYWNLTPEIETALLYLATALGFYGLRAALPPANNQK